MNKNIIVNATALAQNGALTILNQFLATIPSNTDTYYIFVSHEIAPKLEYIHTDRIKIITKNILSILNRIMWDSYGLKKFLKKNCILPDVIISLQNTSINYSKKIKQIIYLHQGVFLHDKRWSLWRSNERKLALYKCFYSLFVFMFTGKNTFFVVQTNWMKANLIKKFNVSAKNIYIIKPDIPNFNLDKINDIQLKHKTSLFYPTSNQPFKNIIELIRAFVSLKEQGYNMHDIGLYLTIAPHLSENFDETYRLIKKYNLENNVIYTGHLPYQKVLEYYKACTALVFPSYIESFGLPLLEAASLGKKIIAVDLDYTKEVLENYPKVIFAKLHNPTSWAAAMITVKKMTSDEPSPPVTYESSWHNFFTLVSKQS